MNQALKPIPHFTSEGQERNFWEAHDMVDHMQEVTEPVQFRNLKPSIERQLYVIFQKPTARVS